MISRCTFSLAAVVLLAVAPFARAEKKALTVKASASKWRPGAPCLISVSATNPYPYKLYYPVLQVEIKGNATLEGPSQRAFDEIAPKETLSYVFTARPGRGVSKFQYKATAFGDTNPRPGGK
jgi:hypothetical protein